MHRGSCLSISPTFCSLAVWCFCYIRPHFRRASLDAVGAWDPFNVTEDADLGLRLARHGYRVGMITRPTYEDAPEKLGNWLPQRTRWFKGWMHLCED
jgi:cellulose synthase/poly-beta-1,6-N-acetylglucosamine synthase-like glycosyltransferase